MRRLLLSAGIWALACPLIRSQAPGASHDGNNLPQIPFGQIYKDFQFPLYQNGQLSATLSAVSAKGITINRAECTDLKIDIYTNGKVTTTITSPKADLYVTDRKMRTKNTVQIERADMEATSQACDFDLPTRKYLLRQNVRVVLKNFDAGAPAKNAVPDRPIAAPAAAPQAESDGVDEPMAPSPTHAGDSLLDVPGASAGAGTNSAPSPHP